MRKRSGLAWLLLFACGLLAVAAEENWPQFRGPGGDGVAANAGPPVEWSETLNIAWKVPIPGCGRSSPVILGNRIWLTTASPQGVKRTKIGGDDMQTANHVAIGALCLDRADGKSLWQVTLWEIDNPAPVHWLSSWATPTPVVEPGRLYCDFGTFGTACLDAETGEVLWQQKLPLDHQVGPGSSPALCENLLILVRDGRNEQYVTALDKNTGQPVWKTSRPPLQGAGDQKKSFCTPLITSTGGKTQIIVPGAHWVISYDPASGKEFWRAKHSGNWSLASRPVFGHGMAFFSTGCVKPVICAVRVDGEGDVTATHIAWKCPHQAPVMSSPIVVGDEIYWVSDAGIICCADAKTGVVHWQERIGGNFLASPVFAAGKLYFFSQEGKATVLKAGKKFERLAGNSLTGTVIASPAMLQRSIFLRTDTHLYRIEADKKQ